MKLNRKEGSTLAVAMIFALALAAGAVSYIQLSLSSLKQANRSFYYNSALNLAEAGAEEALSALNNGDWTQLAWTSGADRTFVGAPSGTESFKDANNTTGYFKVLVKDAAGPAPTITAEGVVRMNNGSEVRKQVRMYAKTANVFLPPFTAINRMDLNGGEIDSYSMADGHYTTARRKFETTVASPTMTIGNVDIGSPANIYGHVSVGFSADNKATFVNSIKGELVGPDTTANGTGVVKSGSNLVDTTRISYDFSQDFPPTLVPTTPADFSSLPAADSFGVIQIGTKGATTPTVYSLSAISLKTGEKLVIVGPVELRVSGSVDLSGQAALIVLAGKHTESSNKGSKEYLGGNTASAKMYVAGNIDISGHGTSVGLNAMADDPATLQIFGTAANSQTIKVGGNGNFGAAIYAPKADATFNGGGSSGYFAGAIVARNITVNGNGYRVRFPEELSGLGTANSYQISKWVELTNRADWHTF